MEFHRIYRHYDDVHIPHKLTVYWGGVSKNLQLTSADGKVPNLGYNPPPPLWQFSLSTPVLSWWYVYVSDELNI